MREIKRVEDHRARNPSPLTSLIINLISRVRESQPNTTKWCDINNEEKIEKDDYKFNLADYGLVVSLMRRRVCEKYGQSS